MRGAMADAEPPLPASTLVPALSRQVMAAGGFATVLKRGSQWGGALLLVHRRGRDVTAYEKMPTLDGGPLWRAAATGDSAVNDFVAAQQRFDSDLWVLELDIADPARFIPGFPAVG
jgi:hypothetical protein